MSTPNVQVLLATYNGIEFLREQLDSILHQTLKVDEIIISDDQSTDGTWELLNVYREQHPSIITILNRPAGTLGAAGNFSKLLEASTGNYVFLCDQDDVWFPEKVDRGMNEMDALEHLHGRDTPLLVYTDLVIVDRNLKLIADSYWEYARIKALDNRFAHALVQNMVTGCTACLNRALVKKALPISEDSVMHDWWLALVATAFGKAHPVDWGSLLYRQHSRNSVGAAAAAADWVTIWRLVKGFSSALLHRRQLVAPLLNQAAAFHARFSDQLTAEQRSLVEALQQGGVRSAGHLLKNGAIKYPLAKGIGLLISII